MNDAFTPCVDWTSNLKTLVGDKSMFWTQTGALKYEFGNGVFKCFYCCFSLTNCLLCAVLMIAGNAVRLGNGVNSNAGFYWRTSTSQWKEVDMQPNRNEGCLVTISTNTTKAMFYGGGFSYDARQPIDLGLASVEKCMLSLFASNIFLFDLSFSRV